MVIFDPRTISSPVYEALNKLRKDTRDDTQLKEQKNQAIELYTYVATWGLMRLKAEETAINKIQEGKRQVVQEYFKCLENLSPVKGLSNSDGLEKLKPKDSNNNGLTAEDYLGLTGLGLQVANEFAFWANAIYHDITGDNQ